MKFLIAGMGITGRETARFLQKHGIAFDTYDDRKDKVELVRELGHDRFAHHSAPGELQAYDEIIVSPGLAWDHPLLRIARSRGLRLSAEVELAFRHARGKIIAVTGSNGKSTTVSLIHHLLHENGFNTSLCGNIGVPFIARVSPDPAAVYVLEISSFQMEHVHEFRPHIGVLLNISPDHLDRHGNFETYAEAKRRLFANQKQEHLAIATPKEINHLPGKAARLAVPSEAARIEDGRLQVGSDFALDAALIPLLGKHNLVNALFACVVVRELGLSDRRAARAIPSYKGLEHRMELVGKLEQRLWINDTKATNVHATQAAVDSLTQPYVLILGGCDKGERFSKLGFTNIRPKAVVAYGETAPLICKDLAALHPIHIHRFEDACLKAHALASPGEAVLLAPACASFDQFDNFGVRGKVFKHIFRERTDRL